ncbi:MoaB/Mog domain-containing protein [Dipodascopsis uninucleata]
MATTTITTAACLIIGDEVLNGKIRDANSHTFAKFCFEIGIDLRRIEVIGDDSDEIAEAAIRMAENYDFVVTSGGIGPTHDDITYESIAKAFNLPLQLHGETVDRMAKYSSRRIDPTNTDAHRARMRMATLPINSDIYYPLSFSWVPVVCVAKKIHILPGIPQLFTGLLNGLRPTILPRVPTAQRKHRLLVSTSKPESEMAPFLTALQKRVEKQEIKIGSYPHMASGINTVSIIGKEEYLQLMQDIVKETEKALDGKEISIEEEVANSLAS